MWTYWPCRRGRSASIPAYREQRRPDAAGDPRRHRRAALLRPDGSLITDKLWGLYYKPDFHFGGVQGGATPATVERPADEARVDPYGPTSPPNSWSPTTSRICGPRRSRRQKRFEGQGARFFGESLPAASAASRRTAFRCSTVFRENVYVIADFNDGRKMIGVGEPVPPELFLGGARSSSRSGSPLRRGTAASGEQRPFPWSSAQRGGPCPRRCGETSRTSASATTGTRTGC